MYFPEEMWYTVGRGQDGGVWRCLKIRVLQAEGEGRFAKRKGFCMLWLMLGALCLIYYVILETLAAGQELTVVWLGLAALFLCLYLYRAYRRAHPGKEPSLWQKTFCTTSLILLAVLLGVAASRIAAGMLTPPPEGLEYIAILSEEELPGESERELADRLDRAVAYLQENPQTRVIVSGGWDSVRGSSRAHVMYQYLLRHGIGSERIFWETYSRSTRDNLINSAAIAGGRQSRLGIVVSDYFTYRAMRIARGTGLYFVCGIPSATPLWLLPHRLTQELLQVLYDKFMGF